jgi:hypothetical protein
MTETKGGMPNRVWIGPLSEASEDGWMAYDEDTRGPAEVEYIRADIVAALLAKARECERLREAIAEVEKHGWPAGVRMALPSPDNLPATGKE